MPPLPAEMTVIAIRAAGGYVNIDQPRLRDCLPPTAQVFGTTGYVRLHGRNAATWFARGLPSFERYNYLYSTPELEEWAGRIRQMLTQARDVYVFANNHYNGQGVANALECMFGICRQSRDIDGDLQPDSPFLRLELVLGLGSLPQIALKIAREGRRVGFGLVTILPVGTAREDAGFSLKRTKAFGLRTDLCDRVRRCAMIA